MKKRILCIILFLFLLVLIAGCGINQSKAMKIAEDTVEQEFKGLPNDVVDYEVKAVEATKSLGKWNIKVNVTITERIEGTELFTHLDGYYLVSVDSKGNVISSELKQMGEFRP